MSLFTTCQDLFTTCQDKEKLPRKEKGPLRERDAPSGPVQAGKEWWGRGPATLPNRDPPLALVLQPARGRCGFLKCGFYSSASLQMLLWVPCVRGSYAACSMIRSKARGVPKRPTGRGLDLVFGCNLLLLNYLGFEIGVCGNNFSRWMSL